MLIRSFGLQNYRSIRKAEGIALGDFTVLIGPNNEGKSNMLTGLVTGLNLLTLVGSRQPTARLRQSPTALLDTAARRGIIDWDRDASVGLRDTPSAKVVFDFEFELSPDEILEFKSQVKSSLNGRLPMRVSVSRDKGVELIVKKPGRGSKTLNAKSNQIAFFIGRRIRLQSIPAIRTDRSTIDMVREMVVEELASLRDSPEYVAALGKIEELQRPILEALQTVIHSSLEQFLPDVRAVEIRVQDREMAVRRDIEVLIDDGVTTPLAQKGDGIKSLAALSLTHHLSKDRSAAGQAVILAVEEPEAHLHPRAIHALRAVLQQLATEQQVVITTHSPVLANRRSVGSNVVVHKNKASSAKTLAEIREVLGVHVGDNLASAELVLLVEGPADESILSAILAQRSASISDRLADGRLVIQSTRGVRNLSNQLALLRGFLCEVHVVVDNDQPARDAVKKAESLGLLAPSEYHLCSYPGMKDSELEDLLDVASYAECLTGTYGLTFPTAQFDARKGKWSDRVETLFTAGGKAFDEPAVKKLVSDFVALRPEHAVHPAAEPVVAALVEAIESRG